MLPESLHACMQFTNKQTRESIEIGIKNRYNINISRVPVTVTVIDTDIDDIHTSHGPWSTKQPRSTTTLTTTRPWADHHQDPVSPSKSPSNCTVLDTGRTEVQYGPGEYHKQVGRSSGMVGCWSVVGSRSYIDTPSATFSRPPNQCPQSRRSCAVLPNRAPTAGHLHSPT